LIIREEKEKKSGSFEQMGWGAMVLTSDDLK